MHYNKFLNKLNDNKSLRESWEIEAGAVEWRPVATKSVRDFDGFMTEYTWYTDGENHIFMFGDTDFIEPSQEYADFWCDSERVAQEWFDSYTGFEEEDEDLEENVTLNESFDNLPQWITSYLETRKDVKSKISQRGVNLKTAVFEPVPAGNITKADLTNPSKLWILLLQIPNSWSGSRSYIYIPSMSSTDIDIMVNNRTRRLSNIALDRLIEMIRTAGYIDLTDPSNMTREIRNSRKSDPYNTRDYSKVQYPRKVNIEYGVKPDGSKDYDNIISYDIEWLTHKGYDKNGYKLDPDKYIRILNDVGCDNCGARLDRMFDQLESIRSRLVNAFSNIDATQSHKYRVSGFNNELFDEVGGCIRDFSSILSSYKRFKERIENLLNKDPRPDNIDERIKTLFEWDADSISKDIKALSNRVKGLENPIKLPEEPNID